MTDPLGVQRRRNHGIGVKKMMNGHESGWTAWSKDQTAGKEIRNDWLGRESLVAGADIVGHILSEEERVREGSSARSCHKDSINLPSGLIHLTYKSVTLAMLANTAGLLSALFLFAIPLTCLFHRGRRWSRCLSSYRIVFERETYLEIGSPECWGKRRKRTRSLNAVGGGSIQCGIPTRRGNLHSRDGAVL
jgi:hypothetical protein